jgi:hypothetical protein
MKGVANQDPWWQIEDEEERTNALISSVRTVKNVDQWRQDRNVLNLRLYAGRQFNGIVPVGATMPYVRDNAFYGFDDDRIRLNVIQSVTDTLTAKIGKNRPLPTLLTNRGDWEARQAAMDLSSWIEGSFYEARVYDTLPLIFRDAAIFGTGIIHPFRSHGKVCAERVYPSEILVDPVDSMYGDPRILYRVKMIEKNVLAKAFPRFAETIELAPENIIDRPTQTDQNTRMVEVVEAWHLPSSPEAEDGKHIIAVEGAQLNPGDDEWTREDFPFVFFHWSRPVVGFWGVGASERLTSIQLEINRILAVIQDSFRLLAKPTVYVEEGSKIVKQHLTNEVANIVTYRGNPPVVSSPQTVHPEVFRQLDWYVERAYAQEGANEMAAAALKPAGIESGKGLRVLEDQFSDRFMTLSRQLEEACTELSRKFIAEAKAAIESGEELDGVVMSRNRRAPRKVDFHDIELSEDAYVIQTFPISNLSTTPAARMEDIQDLMGAGLLDPTIGRRLLDFPDLDAEDSIDFAPIDYVDWRIEKILKEGEAGYESPNGIQDLNLTILRCQKVWQRESINGAPEDRLALLEQYLMEAVQMKQEAEASQMEQLAQSAPGAEQLSGAQPAPQMTPVQAMPALPQGAMA